MRDDFNFRGVILGAYMPIDRPSRAGPCVRLRISSCFQSWEQNRALPIATASTAMNREGSVLSCE